MKITLPKRPSRDDLASFAFAISTVGGTAAIILAFATERHPGMTAVVALITVASIAGWGTLRPMDFMWPYRAWNRLARMFARLAQRYAMAVTFHLVFSTVSLVGARFERSARGGQTGWAPKSMPTPRSQPGYVSAGSRAEEWTAGLQRWSRRQPNRWSILLVPLLRLLDSLEGQTAVKTSEDIYTLY